MIATLEGHLSKFSRPALADLGWRKPNTVKVRGLEISEQELRDLIKSYEASLSTEAYKELRGKGKPTRVFNTTAVVQKLKDVLDTGSGGQFTPPAQEPVPGFAPSVAPTQADIQSEKKAKARLDYLNGLEILPNGMYEVDGKSVKPSEYAKLLKAAKDTYAQFEGSSSRASGISGQTKRDAEAALGIARSNLNALLERLTNPGIGGIPTDEEIAAASKIVTDLEAQVSGTKVTPTETTETPQTGATKNKFQPPLAVRGRVVAETETTPTPTPTPTPTTPAVPGAKPDQASWVTNQLELRGLQDTPKNRKAVAAEYAKTKFKPLGDNWVDEFNKQFPTLGFIFTNPEFGPEVLAIAKKAVEEQWYLYPETAQALITREIANTPYGQRSSAKQEAFDKKSQADQQVDIAQKVGELQKTYGKLDLSEAEWQQIGYTAARNGLDDTLTQQKMLEFVYQKTPEGAYRYDTAVKSLESGRLGQEVRKVYGDYFVNADEDAIKNYATGATTLEDIRRQSRELAKYLYPALTPMLDQGLTVKNIADQYANIAAETLELPANTINMMDPKYRVAFDVREGDKSRTMTIGEFQSKLKTDPTYGWQYTKSANQQAMDLATTIARAFGKVQ